MVKSKNAAKNIFKNTDKIAGEARAYRFDFIGRSKFVVIASTAFIIAGIIFYFLRGGINGGINLGIDFKGGNLMEVQFTKDVTITELRNTMEDLGYGKAILQRSVAFAHQAPRQLDPRVVVAEDSGVFLDSRRITRDLAQFQVIGRVGRLLKHDPVFGLEAPVDAFQRLQGPAVPGTGAAQDAPPLALDEYLSFQAFPRSDRFSGRVVRAPVPLAVPRGLLDCPEHHG